MRYWWIVMLLLYFAPMPNKPCPSGPGKSLVVYQCK
jgi:hypothetical protein